MRATKPYGEHTIRMATERCITELNTRVETTARGNLSVEKLMTDFLNEALQDGGSMEKPADNAEVFSALLEWIVKSGRGTRLESFLIAAPDYFKLTKRADLTKHASVRGTIKKMREMNPVKSRPKTTGTSELLAETLLTIPEVADTEYLGARESFSHGVRSMHGRPSGRSFLRAGGARGAGEQPGYLEMGGRVAASGRSGRAPGPRGRAAGR